MGRPRHVGQFLAFWDAGSYLVPLAVLELYLRIKGGAGPRTRYAMAASLAVLTGLMGAGIAAFTLFTWKQFLS